MENITKSIVKCDEPGCTWEIEEDWEMLLQWYNKPCPQCKKGVLLNDADIVEYIKFSALATATKMADPEGKLPRLTVKVDTGPLRDKID